MPKLRPSGKEKSKKLKTVKWIVFEYPSGIKSEETCFWIITNFAPGKNYEIWSWQKLRDLVLAKITRFGPGENCEIWSLQKLRIFVLAKITGFGPGKNYEIWS